MRQASALVVPGASGEVLRLTKTLFASRALSQISRFGLWGLSFDVGFGVSDFGVYVLRLNSSGFLVFSSGGLVS